MPAGDAHCPYVNDAGGHRLITRDSTGTTLSIGDLELHLAPGSRFPTGIRTYTFNGQKVAERGSVTGLSWCLADHQGTTYASVNAGDLAVTQRRQDPFGDARGVVGTWPDRHGFVNGVQDTSGLTQLGARGYDSTTGRFTQADPLLDTGDPQAMNGYSYAKNTPISGSDPSGLATTGRAGCTDDGSSCETYNNATGTYHDTWNQGAYDASHGQKGAGGNQPTTTPTQNVAPQPERSECSWYDVGCQIEKQMTVFIAVVTVVAVAATVACAIATAGTCLVFVAAGATEGALWGGTGMLIGAAVAAGGELIGAAAAAGAAGLAAADIAEEAAGDASSLEGAGAAAGEDSGGGGGSSASEPEPAPEAAPEAAPEQSPAKSDGCNSFAAGTAVLMADGSTKPIQDVRVGDRITNKDPDTGKVQTHAVMATHVTDGDSDFVDLTVQTSSGTSTITVTAYHLFWDATTHSWTSAGDLRIGDQLDTQDGGRAAVEASHRYNGSIRTYNLTVDQVHTYRIMTGTEALLVHNCPETSGTALVHLEPGHASIQISGNVEGEPFNIHSELVGTNIAKVRPFSGTLHPDTMTFRMELKDPEMARDFVKIQLRKPNVGRYDLETNSCVAYVCSVLRAGGYSDAPYTTSEGMTWLWNINKGVFETGYGG
ncbi:polymorphic toxin-type HINT domain-containing protein [Kutzneria buriramensis]|uniref:Intein/RHS repeat-associated protein n=1 Tax=Kutzneria buriramensis TaxID=1045776 RepID=A0A3E0HGS5_9PSEU|nr:polymorphic toxin-type HINT domain-containing protein [Kutzneria buriramensis]REH44883.1 intein/RHS repeat-associated protein [Kutzneria buriramensis]